MVQKMVLCRRIRCRLCGDILEAPHFQRFITCSCTRLGLESGLGDTRIFCHSGSGYDDLSIYADIPYSEARNYAYLHCYGRPPYKRVVYSQLSDEDLTSALKVDRGSWRWQLLLEEKIYRAEHEISI